MSDDLMIPTYVTVFLHIWEISKTHFQFLVQSECQLASRRSTPRFRTTIRTRPHGVPICSYGGTFPVSMELPPLPTPDTLRYCYKAALNKKRETFFSFSSFREYTPRKRMYCTLVNPYSTEVGSGR